MKQIVTDVNAELGTLTHSDVSTESLEQNELLIKELLHSIKHDEKFISREEIELIEKYKATQLLIDEVCVELGVSSLSQIAPAIYEMQTELEKTVETLNTRNMALDKKNLYILKLKNTVETKNASNKKLKAENKRLKKTVSNYKSRKVVRLADKLAGK